MAEEGVEAEVGVGVERRKAERAGVEVIRETVTIPVRAAAVEGATETRAVTITGAAAPQTEDVGEVKVEVRVGDAVEIKIRNAAEDTVPVPAIEKRVEGVVPGVTQSHVEATIK